MKLIYEVKDRIARITINRPEAMNAMDADVYAELSRAWIDVRDNPEVWIAIVTGAGDKAFTAGADLKSFIPGTRGKADRSEEHTSELQSRLHLVCRLLPE